MELNLYRLSKVSWAISTVGTEPEVFDSIEKASDFLMKQGVKDDAIDAALIQLEANGDSRANFGIKGELVFTDRSKLNGILGVA